MIKYIKGDIFDSDADYLVNPVNLVGVMGAGLAKEFKKRYPYMFEQYQKWCGWLNKEVDMWTQSCYKLWYITFKTRPRIVQMLKNETVINQITVCDSHNIILFATKSDWRNKSDIVLIEKNLSQIVEHFDNESSPNYPYVTIAFPKLGCGCGGLDWENEVKPLMEKYLKDCDSILAEIYI
jgi:O-acetyl-ADP-ribose deacetylase (regulator of RNase III)